MKRYVSGIFMIDVKKLVIKNTVNIILLESEHFSFLAKKGVIQ